MQNRKKKPETPVQSGRLVFALVARPKINLHRLDPHSHAGATIAALRKLKAATSDQIIAEVAKQKRIVTKMDIYRAVHFQLSDLRKPNRRVLKVVSRRGNREAA